MKWKKRNLCQQHISIKRKDWTFIKFRIATKSFHIKYLFIGSELLRFLLSSCLAYLPYLLMKTWVFRHSFFQSSGLSGAHHCSLHQSEDEQIQDVGADQREALAQVVTSETEKKSRRFLRFTIWVNIACRIDWMHHWELIMFFHGKSVVYCVLVLSLHQNINRESSAWTSQLATGSWDWSLKTARKSRSRTKPPRKTWSWRKTSAVSVSYEVFSWASHWITGDQLKISEWSAIVDVTIPILMGRSRKSFTPAIFAIQYELVKKIVSSV